MGEIKLIIEPDQDEPGAASVYVDGRIDGNPYRFLLDTGAGRSSVRHDDYTATLPLAGTHQSSTVFKARSESLIQVRRLELGPILKENMTLIRATPGPGAQDLIGMDVLRDFCCHFLFHEQKVQVNPERSEAWLSHAEPLLVDEKFHPYIHIHFGEAQGQAVWDTGASLTVVDMSFIQRHPDFFTPAGESTGTDAAGAQVETPMFMMSSASLGGYTFPPHRVAGVDLSHVNATLTMPMDMIIGYSTFRRANWLFDFPAQKWMISQWLDVE